MRNCGQKTLNLKSDKAQFSSVLQIAAVTRPLMSVGRICDNDSKVLSEKHQATVFDSFGSEVCVFQRVPGGLYIAKLELKSPFQRQEG